MSLIGLLAGSFLSQLPAFGKAADASPSTWALPLWLVGSFLNHLAIWKFKSENEAFSLSPSHSLTATLLFHLKIFLNAQGYSDAPLCLITTVLD